MAQGYVYDPSQQISQQFQQAGSSIGNIFTTLVAQKQRDYTLAENAFQNVEALKKNLNIFGQKNITDKSNALLKEASNAIFKEGKIDYGKLGEIRQKVSEINDLKQGYDLGAKEFERMVQLGVANKDNLVSFEKFYKDLSTKMADENLVKNPQDLQRQMTEVYTNNLDVNKLFTKSFLAINPLSKKSSTVDVKDSKGNIVKKVNLAYEAPNGISYDANGNKIVSPELADQFIANIKQTSPELLDMMKKQAGVAGDMLSERDLVNAYINRVPTSIVQKEEKSAEELRIQKAQADMAEFKAKTAPEEFAMEMAKGNAAIASSNASTGYYNAMAQAQAGQRGSTGLYSDTLYDADSKNNVKYDAMKMQTETPITMKLLGGKQVTGLVSDIAVGDNGALYAKVAVGKSGRIKDKNSGVAQYEYHKIDPSQHNDFLRQVREDIRAKGDKATKLEKFNDLKYIQSTLGQLKGQGQQKPLVIPTPKNPNGSYITDKDLESYYGEGKRYKTKQEALDAAVNTYGYTYKQK